MKTINLLPRSDRWRRIFDSQDMSHFRFVEIQKEERPIEESLGEKEEDTDNNLDLPVDEWENSILEPPGNSNVSSGEAAEKKIQITLPKRGKP